MDISLAIAIFTCMVSIFMMGFGLGYKFAKGE
jgi:hypothetical protein